MMARMLVSIGFLAAAVTPVAAQSVVGDFPGSGIIGFSSAVVVSGEDVYVGRPGVFPGFPMPPSRAAGVHVFRRGADGAWTELANIVTPNEGESDGFGASLAVAGDMLVVGAPQARGGAGAAYVYQRTEGGAWDLAATLTTDDAGETGSLGTAVAAHGHMAIVSAPGHDGGRGIVYVFGRHEEDGWRVRHTMAPEGLEEGARFGAALSFSRPNVLVGAPGPGGATSLFGPPPAFQAGAAYVFAMDMEVHDFVLRATLASEAEGMVTQGAAVLLHEGGAMVAAPGANGGAGAVLMYRSDDAGAWTPVHTLALETPQPQSFFGSTIAVTGDDLLVGAPTTGGLAGAVHVFRFAGDSLAHAQELTVKVTGFGGFFGGAVSADGDLAVMGAPAGDMFTGVGFVFERGADGWTESAELVDPGAGIMAITGEERRCEEGRSAAWTCSQVDLVAFVPAADLGADRGVMLNDVWGWTDPETGKEYALVGRTDAMTFVDISDPGHPVYLGELPRTEGSPANLWESRVHRGRRLRATRRPDLRPDPVAKRRGRPGHLHPDQHLRQDRQRPQHRRQRGNRLCLRGGRQRRWRDLRRRAPHDEPAGRSGQPDVRRVLLGSQHRQRRHGL
jgi:hypothetical protein